MAEDNAPIPVVRVSREKAEDWLEKAKCRKLNIWDDQNEIIVHLARELLSALDELEKDERAD